MSMPMSTTAVNGKGLRVAGEGEAEATLGRGREKGREGGRGRGKRETNEGQWLIEEEGGIFFKCVCIAVTRSWISLVLVLRKMAATDSKIKASPSPPSLRPCLSPSPRPQGRREQVPHFSTKVNVQLIPRSLIPPPWVPSCFLGSPPSL